jgi:hypothetical protein
MGTPEPMQLQPVLHGAQEPVGAVELGGVVAADVPVRRQRLQCLQGVRAAQPVVGPTVHELEQLHGELDVAQPTRTELELAAPRVGRQCRLDPSAHLLHVDHEVVATGSRPHERRDGHGVLPAQLGVARDGPGLEQRLELPRLGPALVVGHVAGEGAHQRTGLALRPKGRIDGPDRALTGARGADPHERGRQQCRGAQCRRLVRIADRLGHEHDVDVADVVELPAAALAHRDDREAAFRRAGGQLGARHRQRRLQGRGGEVGELGRYVVDPDSSGEIAGRDVDQHPPVRHAQRVHRRRPRQPGPGGGVVRLGAHGREQSPAQLGGRPLLGLAGRAPVIGMAQQVLGEGGAGAEHREQAIPRSAILGEGRRERFGVRQPGGELLERGQRGIRVGRQAERGDQVFLVADAQPGK